MMPDSKIPISDMVRKRRKVLLISPEILVFAQETIFQVETGLPDDARVVRAYYDEARDCFAVVVESEQFEVVEWGDSIPFVKPPMIRRFDSELESALRRLIADAESVGGQNGGG